METCIHTRNAEMQNQRTPQDGPKSKCRTAGAGSSFHNLRLRSLLRESAGKQLPSELHSGGERGRYESKFWEKTTNRRHRLDVGIDAPRGEKMCMKMNQLITSIAENKILHDDEKVQKVVYCRR